MNIERLAEMETRVGSAAKTYRRLGVSKVSWHEYKRGATDVPLYVQRSVQAHLYLAPRKLQQLVEQDDKEAAAV